MVVGVRGGLIVASRRFAVVDFASRDDFVMIASKLGDDVVAGSGD